jgi:Cdc6-like AAA superfamily ATPase
MRPGRLVAALRSSRNGAEGARLPDEVYPQAQEPVRGDVTGFFRCRHEEYGDVLLNSALVLGTPGSGKSTLVHYVISRICSKYSNMRCLNILTRHIDEFFRIPQRHAELAQEIAKAELINVFIDDALTSLHSHLRKRAVDVNYAIIRHIVRMIKSGAESVDESYGAEV